VSVKEVRQALGTWGITLRPDTPRELIQIIEANKFGHIAIVPGRINPKLYGDALLREARYVGVYRSTFKQSDDTVEIKGTGMAFWLGDEDNKGDIFETAVVLAGQTFANSIRALLPPNGGIIEGDLFSVGAGLYTGRHQWETPRQAITYVTDTFSSDGNIVEWRANGDGTLDAGPIESLYNVTTPSAILVRNDTGRDMRLLGLQADMSMDYDVEDLTTRIVLLAQGEGTTIATGTADADPFPYKNLFGDPIRQVRLVSESETVAGNADIRAQLQLNRWSRPRQAIQIRTEEFDIKGDFVVGDYIYVFDPEAGFFDLDNEVFWRGQPVNPIALRVIEIDWQIRHNWTVAFRTQDGVWLDLSEYYKPEGGGSTLAVGDYRRTLAGNNYESLGFRPNLPPPGADSTVPASPAFTGFSVGSYQSATDGTVKAAIRAQWSEPLNTDGSVITDGDHYEIRHRINNIIGYQISWDTAEDYSWDDLGSWDALLSEPIDASPEWLTIYAGWDQTAHTIMELTPGVTYEVQIRAVDAATPPNRGAWSASSFVTTVGDIFAPSTPAAPTVAASLIAIQVIHHLGKSSGGTFNLEPDLDHLEVHVGGSPSFLADNASKVGELIATGTMVLGSISAVGTFQIEQIDDVYIKVVAVDKSGNKSSASVGVQATVELIDDAHISNLTVSKITAGTITATWINAGRIATADAGRRVEMDGDGIKTFNADGHTTIQMRADEGRINFYEPGFAVPPLEIGELSVGGYGMRVSDLFDETKVLVGQLDAAGGFATENYGLAARDPDTGSLVSLATLAFGMEADKQGGFVSANTTTYTTKSGGPILTGIRIGTSRRALVVLSCDMIWDYGSPTGGFTSRTGYMGFRLIDDADGTEVQGPFDNFARVVSLAGTAGSDSDNGSQVLFLDGSSIPAAGTYTFECMYKTNIPTAAVTFQSRSLIVMPF